MLQSVSYLLLPTLVIAAATTDILSLRIPNWLNALIALSFFPMAFFTGLPLMDVLNHVGVAFAMLMVGFAVFSYGIFGGGDAKLAAAIGLWFGSQPLMEFLIVTAFAGGALSLVVLGFNAFKQIVEIDFADYLPSIGVSESKIPYGVALAAGAVIAFPQSIWMPH